MSAELLQYNFLNLIFQIYLQESILQRHCLVIAAVSLPHHPQNHFQSYVYAA